MQQLQLLSNDIQENVLCEDSREVAINIAGYITKKMLKKSKCSRCHEFLKSNQVSSEYVNILSRGGLTKPSKSLADFVCAGFAILDTAKDLLYHYSDMIKNASLLTLELFQTSDIAFMCHNHEDLGKKLAHSIIANIFFNDEQSITNANVRNDEVASFKVRQLRKSK